MRAYIDKEIGIGFLLDEEKLIKLIEIIQKRLQNFEGYKFAANVKFADGTETVSDVDELVKNDRPDYVDIKKLEIVAVCESGFIRVKFQRGEKVSYTIQLGDSDVALLMSSDVSEFLRAGLQPKPFGIFSLPMTDGRLSLSAFLVVGATFVSGYIFSKSTPIVINTKR